MSNKITLEDFYAERVASMDGMSATYGFVREEYDEGLSKIMDSLDMDYTWIGAASEGEDIFYSALTEHFDVLEDSGKDSTYRIKASKEDFRVLEQRLDQHFSRGYDRPELVGILRAEFPDVSQRRFRREDDLPSEQPFKSSFGSWNNALWSAGLETDEQLTEEELAHQLIRKTHELNKERDILIETASAREINESEDMHNERSFQDAFGSIEEAYEDAGLGEVRVIEEEMEDWRSIIYTPHSDLIEVNELDAGHRL